MSTFFNRNGRIDSSIFVSLDLTFLIKRKGEKVATE